MKKFLFYGLTLFIALGVILVSIPEFICEIKKIDKNAHYYAYAILLIGTIYNYFITIVAPLEQLNKKKRKQWKDIEAAAEQIRSAYVTVADLHFNIMIPKRKFLCKINPSKSDHSKTEFSFFPKVFKVIWSYGHHVNSKLKFTVEQGSCGQAYNDEDCCGFDLEALLKNAPKGSNPIFQKFNLSQKQIDLTSSVTMVASCPIVLKKNGTDSQHVKIIGVLNVESRTTNAGKLIENETTRRILYESLNKLAETYLYFQF